LAPFAFDPLRALAAARAMPARGLPPESLHGHPAEREKVVGQPRTLHGDEGLAREALGNRRAPRHRQGPAGNAVQGPEPEWRPALLAHPEGALAARQQHGVALALHEQSLLLYQQPVPDMVGRLGAALGWLEASTKTVPVERQVDRVRRHDLSRFRLYPKTNG